MWLFTQHGCYSVVLDGQDHGYVLLQGRKAEHLENLRAKFDYLEDHPINISLAGDYPYLLRLKRSRWLTLAQDLAGDVRYTNFKNAAGQNRASTGPRYVILLHKLWQILADEFSRDRPRRQET